MQYIAGRTAQDYNCRKKRKGAFWEDRYHATAIESGQHLIRCMTYIDMNMVRAGVAHHPSDWAECAFKEILMPRQRYGIIHHQKLLDALNVSNQDELKDIYPHWLNEVLAHDQGKCDERWSRAIAIGSPDFVEGMRRDLGLSLGHHKIIDGEGASHLMESAATYGELNTVPFNDEIEP
jgi:putative transposase